jgi:hypothetical protein
MVMTLPFTFAAVSFGSTEPGEVFDAGPPHAPKMTAKAAVNAKPMACLLLNCTIAFAPSDLLIGLCYLTDNKSICYKSCFEFFKNSHSDPFR